MKENGVSPNGHKPFSFLGRQASILVRNRTHNIKILVNLEKFQIENGKFVELKGKITLIDDQVPKKR